MKNRHVVDRNTFQNWLEIVVNRAIIYSNNLDSLVDKRRYESALESFTDWFFEKEKEDK
jgi:urease accessory protein UreF